MVGASTSGETPRVNNLVRDHTRSTGGGTEKVVAPRFGEVGLTRWRRATLSARPAEAAPAPARLSAAGRATPRRA